MTCPYLEYRRSDDEHEFDHERPYCGVTESFVSPMRADICNDRHAFDHTSDCELFPDETPSEASSKERSDGEANADEEMSADEEVSAEGETDSEGPIRADPSE